MFEHYKFIEDTHRPVLEMALRQRTNATGPLLAKLYEACLNTYALGDQAPPVIGLVCARLANDKQALASATEEKSGVYVQLAGTGQPGKNGKQLTVGQKWAMQGKNDALSTTATKIWL